jgi:hypothetical protein
MADQRCPLCGRTNSEELETCQFCGARLTPLVAPTSSTQKYGPDPKEIKDLGNNIKPEESALPDWIKALRNGENQSPQGEEKTKKPHFGSSPGILTRRKPVEPDKPGKDDEIPDWLTGLRSMASPGSSDKPAREERTNQPEGENQVGEEWSSLSPGITEGEGDSTPDWLSRLEVEPQSKSTSETKAAETQPEWIRELQPEEKNKEEPVAKETEELPKWLAQLPSIDQVEPHEGTGGEFFSSTDQGSDRPATEQELVDWFAQLQSTNKTPDGMELQADETTQEGTSELITDANQVTPVIKETGIGEESVGGGEGKEKIGTGAESETPDWLSALSASQKSDERDEAEIPPESMGTAELPSWVQALRPMETILSGTDLPEADAISKTETIGPLMGLAGVLPAVSRGETTHKPPVSQARLQINSNQQKYAAQLEKMIQEEGQARTRKPPGMNPSKVLRFLLSFILIGAVILPILTGGTYTPEMKLFPSEWGETNQLLRDIPAGSTLLVVFDYDPALASELEAAAVPVVNNLLTRAAHLVLISTNPVGPALAERFLETAQPISPTYDLAYTNLGYLAGGQAGIQFFATDPRKAAGFTTDGEQAWDAPALTNINKLSDFRAVIILTDNADTGRSWIEQTKSSIGDTPLVMIISAQAEPLIRPYFDSGQVGGLISGLMGGKTYEQTYATPGLARHYWDAFGSGTLTAVILIAAGSLWSAVKSLKSRKKAGIEK